jgi:eukaryotic-like serine/threonine-protein kinase
MTIPAGTRLGPYDVVALVGAGGMGAVYRAVDPRLRREVAIKVLPPAFAGDPDRVRRFEQEALAVARLAHPGIVAVHDVGTQEGSPYVVMELLEGEPLRRVMTGPLPVPRAVGYAVQVARALAAAHEHGIVHRDIKPENLFVTRGGAVKILDFGLAKLTDREPASDGSAATLTEHGVVLGTAAYMSPEQVQGVRCDHRCDLFSLGVVLHEMLSGISPFRRGTAAETMTAVLREDPAEITGSTPLPRGLDRVLRRCLEKDPASRFQAAADLAFALEPYAESASAPAPAARRRSARAPVWLLLVAAIAAGAALGYRVRQSVDGPADGATIDRIYRVTDFEGLEEFPALAPDRKSVAFTARVAGFRQIFVRLLAGGPPLQITKGSADHEQPRWGRDSSSVTYFSPAAPGDLQGTIWEVPALGGSPRRVIDCLGGADVGADGRVACFRLASGQIELVSASADESSARVITRFREPVYYKHPRWSPDAKWIAYQRGDGVRWDVFVVPVDGGDPRQLTHDNGQIHGLAWRHDGRHLVYSSSRGTTMSYLPTLGLWELPVAGGDPRRIAPADVSYLYPDVHDDDTIVATRLQMKFDLWAYPIDGTPVDNVRGGTRITRQTGQVQTPTAAADGREIAFLSDSGGHANLWVIDRGTGELRQITHERDDAVALGVPIWSPDGKWIAFVSSRGSVGLGFGLWAVNPDGGNLRNLAARGLGAAWASDGQWIYYIDRDSIYKVPGEGGAPVHVRGGAARNVIGVHDGTLYFMVDRTLADGSAGFEIHAATPEDAPSRVLARIAAGRAPQWQIINPSLSPDGRWLAMPLTDGGTTNIWTFSTATSEWRQITDFGQQPIFIARRVAWAPDGRSIVAAVGIGDADVVMLEPRPPAATPTGSAR